jgi:hypothetical protein
MPSKADGQTDVAMNRYDGARSGANLTETVLTPATVDLNHFGKLYSYPVDGAVYAQPLYLTNVMINGVAYNVLYVATMNDKVYAFDADRPAASPLWMTDFTHPPSVTAVPITDIVSCCGNIFNNVGIESTPVINRDSGMLYVVARTKENGTYVQRLHALDIATGLDRVPSATIAASVPGSAPDSTVDATGQRVITFDPRMQQQRAALALTNNVVLVAWAGHEDQPPFHGWIMGFDAATLARVGVTAVTPDVNAGGIWQGGRAPTLDAAGNAYFATGNGNWDGLRNFGDSLVKFSVSRTGLNRLSFFTPDNEAALNAGDYDLSGSGFTLLPGPVPGSSLLLGGGKEGVLYLLNPDTLGGKQTGDPQVVQKIFVNGGHVMGGPVVWNSATAGTLVFNWSETDVLRSYQLQGGLLTPHAAGQVVSPGHPGGSLTVSANGSLANTGIVWASMPAFTDAKHVLTTGILRAYDADTLKEIWTSEQNAARDRVGTLVKFVPPLVVNGRVYMATQDNTVDVYGLLPPNPAPEIVLYAKDAQPIAGTWRVVADSTAAGGARIWNPDAGVPKIAAPAALPANYFDLVFNAPAGVPYQLWLRMRADNDSYQNDSVFVQFSDSVDAIGNPLWQIGSASATVFSLEDCGGCGEQGWGWNDNGYGTAGQTVTFATSGAHTIRIQQREDGISIDQIVLSSRTWISSAPGANKNDTTILPRAATSNQPPTIALTGPPNGATYTAPASVVVIATASDPDGSVSNVAFYVNGVLKSSGPPTGAQISVSVSGLAAGAYSFTAVATDNQGASTTSSAVSITVIAAPSVSLPAGWTDADVGATGAAGSATYSNDSTGTFTVKGAGADVWGTSDAFNFASTSLSGDGTIVARVASVSAEANWVKAGVMIRTSLDPSSAQAFMFVSHAKGVCFQRRVSDGNTSVSTCGSLSTAPHWVKLTRAANLITASESADGTNWTTVGSDTFAMPNVVDAGLAVSSHVAGTLSTATFDSVAVSQTIAGGGQCGSLTLSQTSFYSGGPASTWQIVVTAPSATCTWTASIDQSWLLLNGVAGPTTISGTGSGQVTLQTSDNRTGANRIGTFTIGGTVYKVTQEPY